MPAIKGITWNHARGYQPLAAIASEWFRQKGTEVKWDIRSLQQFGDQPIEVLANSYDLLIIDHPYVGSAEANQSLIALDEHLPVSFIQLQKEETVGPCFESYWYAGHCRALPIDAAAQVAAWKKDIAKSIDWEPPLDVRDLEYAASALPAGKTIAVPLCPTDIWCVFLSLCALHSDGQFFSGNCIDTESGTWALEQLASWKRFLYKDSLQMNPIQVLEHMATHDDIVYAPFTFGYTNYSRKGWRKSIVHFCNAPLYKNSRHSTLLGGAGIAISSSTIQLDACLAFVQFALSPEIQKGLYFAEQGQPAHRAAWVDRNNNEKCSGFFANTMDTMRNAYVRPRDNHFNVFQEKAADFIHESIANNIAATQTINKLNSMYQRIVNAKVQSY
jgi:multiple sugar transport system substrate-binding protein